MYRIPKEIRTDRETIFMSEAWKKKYKTEEMKYMKTTVYHPQTNGQVEWVNRKIKQYLRKYISHHQNNWTELLMILEYTYNMKRTDVKIFTSFQIMYKETSTIIAKKIIHQIQIEEKRDDKLEKRLTGHLASEYLKEDWIYLKRRKRRKNRSSQNLEHRWWSPFKIKRHIGL